MQQLCKDPETQFEPFQAIIKILTVQCRSN